MESSAPKSEIAEETEDTPVPESGVMSVRGEVRKKSQETLEADILSSADDAELQQLMAELSEK